MNTKKFKITCDKTVMAKLRINAYFLTNCEKGFGKTLKVEDICQKNTRPEDEEYMSNHLTSSCRSWACWLVIFMWELGLLVSYLHVGAVLAGWLSSCRNWAGWLVIFM